ncbi:MAG: hypothetical protein ACKO7P_12660, partial [Bacteroidota bacterium]
MPLPSESSEIQLKQRYLDCAIFSQEESDNVFKERLLTREGGGLSQFKSPLLDPALARVRSRLNTELPDDARSLNKAYRQFLKDGSGLKVLNGEVGKDQGNIDVLTIEPLPTGKKRSTIIYCKEGNKITHQYSNFEDESLILRIKRQVIKYLELLNLISRRFNDPKQFLSQISSPPSAPRVLIASKPIPLLPLQELIAKVRSYPEDSSQSISSPVLDGPQSAGSSPDSSRKALELYYQLRECAKKYQHYIQANDAIDRPILDQEIKQRIESKFIPDIVAQRFVQATKANGQD